jgi:hypothetical protein
MWLNGSSSHMKNVDSKSGIYLDKKSPPYFSFDFKSFMKTDKNALKVWPPLWNDYATTRKYLMGCFEATL